jgi:hypothetical protein
LMNPYGPGMIRYVFDATQHPVARSLITEFLPPTIRDPAGPWLFASWALTFLALQLGIRFQRRESIAVLLFAGFATVAARNVVWWGFLWAPLFVSAIGERWPSLSARAGGSPGGSPVLNALLAIIMLGTVTLALPWLRPVNPLLSADRQAYLEPINPIHAAQFLKSQPPGRVFAPMEWSSYLEWELEKAYPVFVDGRIELYPVAVWSEYFQIAQGQEEWAEILDRYQVAYVVIESSTMPGLASAAEKAPQWHLVHQDQIARVYARNIGRVPA